jgi:hypothetical protein
MVGGSLRVLRLPPVAPPLKLVAMILLKVALKHKKSINQSSFSLENYANSRGVEHDVPKTVVMYNNLMGGVDMADQLLTTYDPNVKSVKLWKKLLMNVFVF